MQSGSRRESVHTGYGIQSCYPAPPLEVPYNGRGLSAELLHFAMHPEAENHKSGPGEVPLHVYCRGNRSHFHRCHQAIRSHPNYGHCWCGQSSQMPHPASPLSPQCGNLQNPGETWVSVAAGLSVLRTKYLLDSGWHCRGLCRLYYCWESTQGPLGHYAG